MYPARTTLTRAVLSACSHRCGEKQQSHSRPPPSPDPVWHSVGLVAVGLAVAGVLRPAGSAVVSP